MTLADTCKATLDLLAVYVSLELACNMVFAKMRTRLTRANGNLDPERVAPLRAVLEHGGRTVEDMNNDYLAAKTVAQANGTFQRGWVPPAWRAPHFGIDSDNCQAHNATMDTLRDRALVDWRLEHDNQVMGVPHLRLYLAGMAANSVNNLLLNRDEELYFDGDA